MNEILAAIENRVFGNRRTVLVVFAILTLLLVASASQLATDSNLKKMVPLSHPWIQNLFKYRDDLGLGNDVQIAVETKDGDIFNPIYLDVVRKITDEVSRFEGVDPANIKSLWTPNVRWSEVTAEGFQGGNVIPDEYDGDHSATNLEKLRNNVLRSGQVGRLVADDFKSSIVFVPLLEADEKGQGGVSYPDLQEKLEGLRDRYQAENPSIRIHIVGFAKKVGELIDGVRSVLVFGFFSLLFTALLLLLDFRCVRAVSAVVICSGAAVFWQLGLWQLLRFGLDPYSVLVPFLIFAIAVSHSVQIINAIANEAVKGNSKEDAARLAFRALFVPGIVALICGSVGFATMYIINIGVIREMAIAAGLGVAMIALTNLVALPVVMSYVGITPAAIERRRARQDRVARVWTWLAQAASPRIAVISLVVALVGGAAGWYVARDLQVGDLDRGAPELWPNPCAVDAGHNACAADYVPKKRHRYNADMDFITANYSVSADVLVVMAETPPEGCNSYAVLSRMDDLQWRLENTPGVQSTISLATVSKSIAVALNEGNYKWYALSRDQNILNSALGTVPMPTSLFNQACTMAPVFVFLDDHKAATLERATATVEAFAKEHDKQGTVKFLLASGNAGIEAATNQSIAQAEKKMLLYVYLALIAMVWIGFRSWRAVVCMVVPLVLTSILCEALMTVLGIGVKVATLPVIALGVGIGIDYGIYIYSRLEMFLKQGLDLQQAYLETLKTTGKAVSFTGITLAIGVITWAFSPIKFQADMGILLTFMFLWNMIGALWLLPALAHFLLKSSKSPVA